MKTPPPARLFFILARQANIAIVFRRGPSKWVRLIKWDLNTDKLEHGHWFHGKIDETKCDLSPSGEWLIYFASKYGKAHVDPVITQTWTAVSRPPSLTAVGLWPNGGTTYGGGGLFEDKNTLLLNHSITRPHPDFQPKGLQIKPLENEKGKSVFTRRLDRDGWKVVQAFERERKKGVYGKTVKPQIMEKPGKNPESAIVMKWFLNEFKWMVRFYLRQGEEVSEIPNAQWVEWDHKGRLIAAIEGKLFVSERGGKKINIEELKLIADTNQDKPADS